jgi:hypothetical protein
MAKLNLNQSPTFNARVGITAAGEDAKPTFIWFTFKYRTRKELTEWLNSRVGKTDVESFMDFVSGWDIDDLPFNAENVEVLIDKYAGTPTAALQVYIDQLVKAKTGN